MHSFLTSSVLVVLAFSTTPSLPFNMIYKTVEFPSGFCITSGTYYKFCSLLPYLWVPFILCFHLKGPHTYSSLFKPIQPSSPNYVLPPLWSLPFIDKTPTRQALFVSWTPLISTSHMQPLLLSWMQTLSLLLWIKSFNYRQIVVTTSSPIFQNNLDCRYLKQLSSSVCSYLSHYVS